MVFALPSPSKLYGHLPHTFSMKQTDNSSSICNTSRLQTPLPPHTQCYRTPLSRATGVAGK